MPVRGRVGCWRTPPTLPSPLGAYLEISLGFTHIYILTGPGETVKRKENSVSLATVKIKICVIPH